MKKFLTILLSVALMVSFCGCEPQNTSSELKDAVKPATGVRIITPLYDDGRELQLINYDVKAEFDAAGDGVTDDSDAINAALMQATMDGGGTVYLPEGRYYCKSMLMIPENVCLRGEWESPEKSPAGSKGTVIIASSSGGFENETVIYMSKNSAVKGITIIYEKQSAEEPIKYHSAIEIASSRNFTIDNITVVGAYNGLKLGPNYNEIFYLRNVYISALNIGVYNSGTSDTSRMEGVYVNPIYWAENTVFPLNDAQKQAVIDYSFNNSVGLEFHYNDWGTQYNINVSGCKIGLNFCDDMELIGSSFPMNGVFTNTKITDCNTAIYFEQTKLNGICFANTEITTSKQSFAGIDTSNIYQGTSQFLNTTIKGDFKHPILSQGKSQQSTSGSLLFVDAVIEGYNAEENYAITMNGGAISFQNSKILGAAKHVNVTTDKIQSLSLYGCEFGGEKDFKINATANQYCAFDDEKVPVDDFNVEGVKYPEKYPRPTVNDVYNVLDYGADTSLEDNSKAFQKALDAAAKTGGTVYIPGGYYNLTKGITVPSDVELRGCFPMQHMSSETGGTVIFAHASKGKEDGTPLITLEASAGVRGFTVYYPDQNNPAETIEESTVVYPWTVKGTGKNCWAINLCLTNSYNGIDFGTNVSDGAYVDFVGGSPIRRGIFMGNNDSESWIFNCQFNPNYAFYFNTNTGQRDYRLYYCDAFIFGYNKKLHAFNDFVYESKNGFMFMTQNGKGTTGDLINLGVDGSETCYRIYDLDEINTVNCQLTSCNSVNIKADVRTEDTFDGVARFFNGAIWGPTNYPILLNGGELSFNLINLCTGAGTRALQISKGSVKCAAVTFHNDKIGILGTTEAAEFYSCFVRGFKQKIAPVSEADNCKFIVKNSWWA